MHNAMVASLVFCLAAAMREGDNQCTELSSERSKSSFYSFYNNFFAWLRGDQSEAMNETTSKCAYVEPTAENIKGGHYKGMEELSATGLFYAYGPLINAGQVAAWKYNPSTEYIEFWWSKSHCKDMCSSCCDGGKGNEPGSMSVPMNPSAGISWGGYSLKYKFHDGSTVKTDFGSFTLKKVRDKESPYNGAWKLFKDKNEFLDHVYSCSKSEMVQQYKSVKPENKFPKSTKSAKEEKSTKLDSTEVEAQDATVEAAESMKSIAESMEKIADSMETIQRMQSGSLRTGARAALLGVCGLLNSLVLA